MKNIEHGAGHTPSSAAVLPKKVSAPVNSTVPSTSPRTTVEPILQLLFWNIVTGNDSPVNAASSTSISPSFTLQSAGIAEPDARRTRSPFRKFELLHNYCEKKGNLNEPGTSSTASIFRHFPSLFTVAIGFRDFLSAATASPALVIS